ncbi:hypothetical protein [Streptomyces gardneri]|uniref:hypothetical protein n=1 Tax=Streptomyces gardneri TaxID=66892 RepID=UPI0035DD3A3C
MLVELAAGWYGLDVSGYVLPGGGTLLAALALLAYAFNGKGKGSRPNEEPAPAVHPHPQPAHDWAAPLPLECQPLYDDLRAAEAAGDLTEAVALAAKLEETLTASYGPLHPHAVNMLTLRASLTLRQQADWHEAVELLVHTAQRRRGADAQPAQDTVGAARNAHAAWRSLAREDADGAAELAPLVAEMLENFGENKPTRDVLRWVEETVMG